MTAAKECHRCGARLTGELPRPGLSRLIGKVYRDTWRIKFNYLRMNSWDKAVTAQEVVASNLWSEVQLCSDCWGETLTFVNTRIERKS